MKARLVTILLAFAVCASFLFSLWLFHYRAHGYYSYHGDDEARSLISYAVYRGNDFYPGSRILNIKPRGFYPHWIWLPFQFWFNAGLLAVVKNPRWVSFLSNGAFSAGTAVMMFLLVKRLTGDLAAAWGGMLWYMSIPFFRCLNISGLDLPILHFFILAGSYYWLKAGAKPCSIRALWPAAVCFFFASMVRYEGWFFVAAFECAVLLLLVFGRPRPGRRGAVLVLGLPLVFIGIWLLSQRLLYHGFLFLNYYRTEAQSGIGQLFGKEAWWFKATIYPRLAWRSLPLAIILAPFSFLLWRCAGRLLLRYAGLVAIGLAILSAAAVYGGVPYTPERISYIVILLCLPLASAGVGGLAGLIGKRKISTPLIVLALGGIAAVNLRATPRALRNAMTEEIARIGYILEWATDRGVISGEGKIVFEEREVDGPGEGRWDSLRLTLFSPDRLICDREEGIVIRGGCEHTDPAVLASSFLRRLSGYALGSYLQARKIEAAVAWSAAARANLGAIFIPCFSTAKYEIFISPAKAGACAPLREFIAGCALYQGGPRGPGAGPAIGTGG